MSSYDGLDTNTPVVDAPPDGDPTAASPAVSKRDIKPSVAWYWIGAAILVLGTIGSFVLMIVGIVTFADAPNHYERISVPGERTVSISEPGTYHLYGETADYYSSSSYSSSYYSYNTIIRPTVTVTDASGTSIPVTAGPLTSSTSYSANGLSAYDFASIYVPAAGSYTVAVKEPASSRPTRSGTSSYVETYEVTRVAVGNSVSSTAVPELVGSAALGSVSLLLGVFILIMTAVKRNRSRKILFPPRPRPVPYGSFGPAYAPAGPGYGYRPGPGYGPGPGPGYGAGPGYGVGGYPPPGYPPPGYPPQGYPPPGSPAGGPAPAYPPGPYPPAPSGAPSGPPAGSPVAAPFAAASPFAPVDPSSHRGAASVPDAPRDDSPAPSAIRDVVPPVADVPDYLDPPTSAAPADHAVTDHVVAGDPVHDHRPADDADD